MLLLNTYLNYMSRLLLQDGGEENGGLIIYSAQKHRIMVIAPMV